MPITKHTTKGKSVTFCPKCKYYRLEEEEYGTETNKCPKCESWLWVISEYHYYESRKLVCKEASLTDNDECDIHGETLKELKKIFDKGYMLYLIDEDNNKTRA